MWIYLGPLPMVHHNTHFQEGRYNCSLEFSQVRIPVVQSKLMERLSMSEFSQGFDHDGR